MKKNSGENNDFTIIFSIISLSIFIAEITIVPITGYYLYS